MFGTREDEAHLFRRRSPGKRDRGVARLCDRPVNRADEELGGFMCQCLRIFYHMYLTALDVVDRSHQIRHQTVTPSGQRLAANANAS